MKIRHAINFVCFLDIFQFCLCTKYSSQFILVLGDDMNKREKFTYKMIETTVSKGLKYIEENGNRGVRYLIDLGEYFSKDKLQKLFFETANKMLSDENSKYYAIAQKVIKTVDHRILKKFGVNLGYNSLTYGTRLIRENEQVLGHNIPWSIIFDFENTDYTINSTDLSDFLHNCESMGIFCCHFFIGNNIKSLEDILPILKAHEDGSYFIFVEPEVLSDKMIEAISSAGNIAMVLQYELTKGNSVYVNISEKLQNKKCIYGIYCIYDKETADYILNKESMNEYQKSGSTFIYFVCKEKLEKDISSKIANDIKCINNQNEYNMYFIDFYEQIAYMNNIVSSEHTIITVYGDGQVFVCSDKNSNLRVSNMKTYNIFEILSAINSTEDV